MGPSIFPNPFPGEHQYLLNYFDLATRIFEIGSFRAQGFHVKEKK